MLYEIKEEERGKEKKVIYKQFRKDLQKSASYMPIDTLSVNKDPNVYTFFPSMAIIDKIHKNSMLYIKLDINLILRRFTSKVKV